MDERKKEEEREQTYGERKKETIQEDTVRYRMGRREREIEREIERER